MVYYKSYRIIGGKPKLVIVDEDDNIIKNPTKEQKKDAVLEGTKETKEQILRGSIEGRICCRCNADLSSGIPNHGRRYYNNKKEWDGKWICEKCHNELSMLKTKDIREKYGYKPSQQSCLKGRTCCRCNIDLSSVIGQHGRRYYDDKKEWDGKSWICEKCYNELEKIKRNKLGEQRLVEKDNNLKERKCCICGSSETYIYKGTPDWAKHKNDKGIWDGEWLCGRCDGKERQKKPDSQNMIRKGVANIRTGNLRIDSETGKSLIDQAVVVKVLGGKDVNIEMDKFDHFIDIRHEKYGSVDAKGATLKSYKYIDTRGDTIIYYKWILSTRRKVDCNTYICLGYDSERKNIIMVWIIPNEGWICNLSNIDIYKTFRPSKYDQFKVDPKSYNDAYKSLMSYIGDRKFFGIDDIKKWLSIS